MTLPDPGTPFGERVRRRLREEQVIWIVTIDKNGTPQPNPVGFVFLADESILIYNAANANRLNHVVERPRSLCTSTATAPAGTSWS